jgi:uncharacterized membrane protein
MKFNINKFGIAWTTAFIVWNLAFILEGDGIVVHVACMILQTMLLFVFMWLLAVRRKTTLAIEKCQKELEVLKEQRRKLEELEVQRIKLKQIVEEYKNGMA